MREKMKEKLLEIQVWIKENKKKLIVAGVSLGAILLAIMACRNLEELNSVFKSLQKIVDQAEQKVSLAEKTEILPLNQNDTAVDIEKSTSKVIRSAHDVRGHIRNLHEGWSASEEKKALAAERGIDLQPCQTFVDAYSTGRY